MQWQTNILMQDILTKDITILKLHMDPMKVSDPHFFVSLGISEACYDIESAKKIDGGLGPEEEYVLKWAGNQIFITSLKILEKIIGGIIIKMIAKMQQKSIWMIIPNLKMQKRLKEDVDDDKYWY